MLAPEASRISLIILPPLQNLQCSILISSPLTFRLPVLRNA